MSAARTFPTRRGLWFRCVRMFHIIRLNILIDSNMNWLLACAKDSLLDGNSIREVMRQTDELVVELLMWEQS